jgi:hypothetical protein
MVEKIQNAITAVNELLTADDTCTDTRRVTRLNSMKRYLLSWLQHIQPESDN